MGARGVKPKKYKNCSESGHKGIFKNAKSKKNPYTAQISFYTKGGKRNGGLLKNIHLGNFPTLEEAVKVRTETIENLI